LQRAETPYWENNRQKSLTAQNGAKSTCKDLNAQYFFEMKKLFFTAIAFTFLNVLCSFTTITTNVPEGVSDPLGRSVLYCIFHHTDITVFGYEIYSSPYGSWEACRRA
jgi:hypothetical protein